MLNFLRYVLKVVFDHTVFVINDEGGWWYALAKGAQTGANAWGASREATMRNKKLSGIADSFDDYSGKRPPSVDYTPDELAKSNTRLPVHKQITDIAMRRSLGEDVGFDPKWRQDLLDSYDLYAGRANKEANQSASDRISGMGLSGNARVYDEVLRSQQRDQDDRRQQYEFGVDTQDMAAKREDKNLYSNMLNNQNQFNFGQENTGANFDENVWAQEQAQEANRRNLALGVADRWEDPGSQAILAVGQGIGDSVSMGGMTGGGGGGSSSTPAKQTYGYPNMTSAPVNSYGYNDPGQSVYNYGQSGYGTPSASDIALMKAQQSGYNFSR